ncbi:thioredoxin H7-like [Mangifera indica]|uniref:thioredoxin H7-like n=1 Tax=Mangifera indica TaxID=29780 RepID=UPI001CF9D94F|nr:thioredoxin H7-like [Mangifera indica]
MGANMSELENPDGFSPVNTNQLIECHSKNQWKAQFDANKESNKPAVAKEFELIDVLPTVVFVKKGKEIDRAVGAKKEDAQKKIEKQRNF